MTTKKNYYIL